MNGYAAMNQSYYCSIKKVKMGEQKNLVFAAFMKEN
jgi:hypothetical protein